MVNNNKLFNKLNEEKERKNKLHFMFIQRA